MEPLSSAPDVTSVESFAGHQSRATSDDRTPGTSCVALKSAVAQLYRLDDFIKENIGVGFFSEVFKVTHKVTGQVMVLKMNIMKSNRPNMLKEVQLMNKLSHPNILAFMGVCVHEGQLHALTEYINGGRLEQIIQDKDLPLAYSVRMKLALDVAKGMEYLHFKDIFHRDLTSKNILIRKNEDTGDLTAVVGDFGFATKIPRCGGCRLATVGSSYWMSPECLKGKWYDQSSDVFSYGIILCELIARVAADPDEMPRTKNFGLDYIAFGKLCSSHSTPHGFLKLAFTCCNYDPSQRPNFSEIVPQLESIIWNHKVPSTANVQGNGSGSSGNSVSSDTMSSKDHCKVSHRRSLSDDGLRKLSEAMAQQDVHYYPSTVQNPFAHIGGPHGKKIGDHSRTSDVATSESDASYESSTVVAEHVVKPSKVVEKLKKDEESSLLDAIVTGRCFTSDSQFKKDRSDRLNRLEERLNHHHQHIYIHLLHDNRASALVSNRYGYRGIGDGGIQMPSSLPSSPTFSRRAHYSGMVSSTPNKPLLPSQAYRLRTCSSGSNITGLEDHLLRNSTPALRRRGSCESGFFSSVGEDFCPPCDLIASSVTLSSSSAASSLLLDSGGGPISGGSGAAGGHSFNFSNSGCDPFLCPRFFRPFTVSHGIPNTASSDSQEDLSIASDLDHSSATAASNQQQQRALQIHKMVEYFERKGAAQQQREYYRQLRACQNRGGGNGGRTGTQSQRIVVCEGAVRSKLQIFDKK